MAETTVVSKVPDVCECDAGDLEQFGLKWRELGKIPLVETAGWTLPAVLPNKKPGRSLDLYFHVCLSIPFCPLCGGDLTTRPKP